MVDKFIDKEGTVVIEIDDDGDMKTNKKWTDKFIKKKLELGPEEKSIQESTEKETEDDKE